MKRILLTLALTACAAAALALAACTTTNDPAEETDAPQFQLKTAVPMAPKTAAPSTTPEG